MSEPVHVLSEGRPSLDLFWPRDVVGRTLGEHPAIAQGACEVWCGGCMVRTPDHTQHVMFALLAAIEKLRNRPPVATLTAQRVGHGVPESSIGFEPGEGA